ncbi:MAG: hypothetical protein FD162_1407 [Rhodobacteraceae bacterium]|nr:MAG: hypothetical protein FD162_1407 [Paracoccaceae bacterium]
MRQRRQGAAGLVLAAPTRQSVRMKKGEWSDLALSGAEFAVKVTPNARRAAITREEGVIRISVTCIPEDGRATAAVIESLAHALGVAKSRLTLVRGATSRDKLFRLG